MAKGLPAIWLTVWAGGGVGAGAEYTVSDRTPEPDRPVFASFAVTVMLYLPLTGAGQLTTPAPLMERPEGAPLTL
jgi:hypothetical protein